MTEQRLAELEQIALTHGPLQFSEACAEIRRCRERIAELEEALHPSGYSAQDLLDMHKRWRQSQ